MAFSRDLVAPPSPACAEQTESEASASSRAPVLSDAGLVVVLSAVFLAQFDFFVVNVAAPSLAQDLHANPSQLELVVGAYGFGYAALLILSGRLGDLVGPRRVFVTGLVAFGVASAACALAQDPVELVGARLVQGMAAGLTLPQVLTLVALSRRGRARAMAWYGVAGGVGSIAGQTLGGVLTSEDVSGLAWRPIFLVALPVVALAVPAAVRLLERDAPVARCRPIRTEIDGLGVVGIAVGVGLTLVPLALGPGEGWTWILLAMVVAGLGCLALTWRWQLALDRRGGRPLLAPVLVRSRAFVAGLVGNLLFMAYFAAYMFTLTVYLQSSRGLSALAAGMVFVPAGVAFSVTALAAPRLHARVGTKSIGWGLALASVGLVALAVSTAELRGLLVPVVAVALVSAGNGLVLPSLIGATLAPVDQRLAGAGAGIMATAQQFGAATGVATLGGLYLAWSRLHAGAPLALSSAVCVVLLGVVWALVARAGAARATEGGPVSPRPTREAGRA